MIRSMAVALAAATMLTACVGGSEPKPAATKTSAAKAVAPKAGDCFSDADSKLDAADPDFSTRVKCTKRHLYEVTGTTSVPDHFLDAPGDLEAPIRDRLLMQVGANRRSFAKYADATCSKHLWRTVGVDPDSIRSGPARLSDIGAFPAASGITYRHTLTPEPEWSKGQHALICFAEFRDPSEDQGQAAPATVSSYNLKPVTEKFLGTHFPPERRRCVVRSGEDDTSLEPCTRAHDAEIIFTFDARLAFGMPFVKDAIRTGMTDEVIDHMANLCVDILPDLLESLISSDLTTWIWYGNDPHGAWNYPVDLADETEYYPVECQLRPSDPRLLLAPDTIMGRPDRPELEDRSYRSEI